MNESEPTWNFMSSHAHTLICLAENPRARVRDVAERVGITERAAMRIIKRLEEAGVVTRQKEGRRNRYAIHGQKLLSHPLEAHFRVGVMLSQVLSKN